VVLAEGILSYVGADIIIGIAVLAGWIYLIAARGGFWLASVRDDDRPALESPYPPVVAVVPARDEAITIAESIGSLLNQDYPGIFSVVLVDDQSTDDTAAIALRAAEERGASERLTVVSGKPPVAGWMGKTWAQQQGVELAQRRSPAPSYMLLTDADIVHAPDTLAWLVAKAQSTGSVLTSLMAKLNCESFAEHALIPAFIYFFQMLYPFRWVNDPRRGTAAAAGGCMLVNCAALVQAGGVAAIADEVIDDCALARRLKEQGPIWLGLTERVRSIRIYPSVADVRRMVARSAYAQLEYSPLRLAAMIAGLAFVYLGPVVFALFGSGLAQVFGIAAWVLMAVSFGPTLSFYRMSGWWPPTLPGIAVAYMGFTIDSAYRHMRRGGAMWKGRVV
jgi:hopene-associated glycosyltransferase HpnB